MDNPQEFINEKLSKLQNAYLPINLFFLKQTTSTKPKNFFDIKRNTLRDDADNHFKELLMTSLTALSVNLTAAAMNDFFNEENNVPSLIPVSQIDRLSGFIDKIQQFDSIPEVHNENALKEIDVHAFKIELDGSEVIFFTRIPNGGKLKLKTAFLQNGHFNMITDVPLLYEDRVDCIYFSDDDSLLVLNKSEMESIFKFDDYYKQKTKDAYDNKLQNILIKAPDTLFDLIKESPQITKKVTRMARDNKFDISADDLQKHMNSLEENKIRFTEQFKSYRSLDQENGLYQTTTKDEFKVFLNACDKSVEIPLEQKEDDEPDIYLNTSPIKMTR